MPSPQIAIAIWNDHDILTARHQGRALVSQLGFSSADATLIATTVSELARNILLYAHHGEIVLGILENGGRRGVLIVARDEGPGIPEARQAAIAATAGSGAVGFGLCELRRLVDELEIVSAPGRGTTVTVRKWMP
jgi:serine/threonine-protein kinase RsbT